MPSALRNILLVASIVTAVHAADGAPAAAPAWVDLTANLSAGHDGISLVAVTPGGGSMLAGCVGKGLWTSSDAGATWTQMTAFAPTKGDPSCIVFSPDASTYWVSSDDGAPALFSTNDGGKTFKPCGNMKAIADFAMVDEDKNKRTFIVGMQAEERHVETGSGTFFSRNYKLPKDLGYTREVTLVDSKIMLVGSHDQDPKTKQPREFGIFRSDDGGKTWTKISPAEPIGPALVMQDNVTVFWPTVDHLMRSKDKGATWSPSPGAHLSPMVMKDGWMAALGDDHLVLSTDGGDAWDAVGPALPFAADGAVWDGAHSRFVIWSKTGDDKGHIAALQAPDDLTTLVDPAVPRDLVAWDGDTKATGSGWPNKAPDATLLNESAVVRQGAVAMEWHCSTTGWFNNAGFVWSTYPLQDKDAVDASGERAVVVSLKLVDNGKNANPAGVDAAGKPKPGPGLPTKLTFCLNSLDGGKETVYKTPVDLIPLAPKLLDGKWHDVVIPLTSLPGLNTKSIIGMTWSANNGSGQFGFDLYIDNVGFTK